MCFFTPQQMQQAGAMAAQIMPQLGQQISGGMAGSPPGAAPPGGPVVYRPPDAGTTVGIPNQMMPGAGFPVPPPQPPQPMMSPMMAQAAPSGPPPLSPTGPPPGARPLVHRPIQGAARR